MTEVREEGIEALPGTVQSQYIRCNKPNCYCGQGDKRHGPYHYRVWRDGKKVRKAYVPTADVERVQAQCDLYRHYRERLAHAKTRLEAVTGRLLRAQRRWERLSGNTAAARGAGRDLRGARAGEGVTWRTQVEKRRRRDEKT